MVLLKKKCRSRAAATCAVFYAPLYATVDTPELGTPSPLHIDELVQTPDAYTGSVIFLHQCNSSLSGAQASFILLTPP